MKIKTTILLFLLASISLTAQETRIKAPKSIYTLKSKTDFTSFSVVNRKLDLDNAKLFYKDERFFNQCNFNTIPLNQIEREMPSVNLADYKNFLHRTFIQDFRLENDPTLWCYSDFLFQ